MTPVSKSQASSKWIKGNKKEIWVQFNLSLNLNSAALISLIQLWQTRTPEQELRTRERTPDQELVRTEGQQRGRILPLKVQSNADIQVKLLVVGNLYV